MATDDEAKLRSLSVAKALAIAAYGESVAAYRYRTLAEKAEAETQRRLFEQMADEEQGHHLLMEKLFRQAFPQSDFVLTAADKELVIVGPRMIEVNDRESYERALTMIYESERLTGGFYAALHSLARQPDLQPVLQEMADECFEHAERIKSLAQTA